MNGFRSGGTTSNEIKYPANCATRISMEANVAASVASGDGTIDISVLDKLYEPKQNKKIFRIITVIAYIFSVSMVAILLSLYYLFLWDPYIKAHKERMAALKRQQQENFDHFDPLDGGGGGSSLPPLENFFQPPKALALEGGPNTGYTTTKKAFSPSRLEDPFTTYAKAKRAKEFMNFSPPLGELLSDQEQSDDHLDAFDIPIDGGGL